MVECDVGIYYGKTLRLLLDSGMSAVQKFCALAEAGIPGAISTEFSFSCNVDVRIKGRDLLPFLEAHYPERCAAARRSLKPGYTYTIVCYDLS